MKKALLLLFLFNSSFLVSKSFAANNRPDTVTTGIYITSIHNIDFRQKEYAITFWLWLRYKNKSFDFEKNLEIPNAKTVTKTYDTLSTEEDNSTYILMKLECVMKDSWKVDKFPFDYQTLRLTIENTQFDSTDLVFTVDTIGKHYARFSLSGWNIVYDSLSVSNQSYLTAFGERNAKPYSAYSAFRVKIGIKREAPWTLFWKLFLGMYVSFLIAFACFFIHANSISSRFGLNVGSLFAAVGNKYIIDSSLPDSSSPALVDTLHGITLFFIFAVIATTIYSLKLVNEDKINQANRFDKIIAQVFFLVYVIANIYYITLANM